MSSTPRGGLARFRRLEEASLQFLCPRCDEIFLLLSRDVPEGGTDLRCHHCGLEFHRHLERPRTDRPVARCWLCGGDRFYVQKDLNPMLVLPVALVLGILVLLTLTVVDPLLAAFCLVFIVWGGIAVSRLLASCVVCYLCGSIYRGFPLSPEHESFYQGMEERQRRPREEWLRAVLPDRAAGGSWSASP